MKTKESGFTLVELMVVIVIIGLMATVVSVKVIPLIWKANKTVAQLAWRYASALDSKTLAITMWNTKKKMKGFPMPPEKCSM